MSNSNRAWVLSSRPKDFFEKENVRMIELKIPELAKGEFLVKNIWLSFDPTQLNRLREYHGGFANSMGLTWLTKDPFEMAYSCQPNNPDTKSPTLN